MRANNNQSFRISGTVINVKTRVGIAGLRVEAWDNDLIFDDFIGTAITNEKGAFVIEFKQSYFSEIFLDRNPDIFFKIFLPRESTYFTTRNSTLWNVRNPDINIVIELNVPSCETDDPPCEPDPNEPLLHVYGVVRNEFGEPLDSVTVQAFDRDLRNEQLLGSVLTEAGRYEIRYQRSQFLKAEKNSADLVLKVFDDCGKELHKTSIYHNVPDEIEINLNLQGGEYKGPIEFSVLTKTLMPLLDGVSPLELREDDENQDVSFLSGETGQSALTIGTWIACHRLADKTAHESTPLEAEVFFGFMRQGQPSLLYDSIWEDVKHPDRVTLLEDKILRDLANISAELQQSLLEKAVTDNLISARIKSQLPTILETLRQIKLRYAADTTFGAGKGTIGQLLDLTPAAKSKQADFMAAFMDFNGPINEFWNKLEQDKVLKPDIVREVKLTFELGALTRNHIPLVGELKNRFQQGQLQAKRDLAKFSLDDWKRIFNTPGPDGKPIGVPTNIDGDTEEAKMDQYAVILDQRFERSYPTTSFAAKLARTKESPVAAKSDVVRFIENNTKFHLDRYRVDHYLSENKDALKGIAKPEALLTELKSVQRIFKLKPTFQAVDALKNRKIDSAQQIYFMGKGQFVSAMTDSGINKIEAKKLYYKAENAYALAISWYGIYNNAVNGVVPYGVPSPAPNKEAQAKIGTLPNLQTLFGSLDYCECVHCRSVYSPAAYFVDVMRFLNERGTQGSGINKNKSVKQVLFERRPDLGEIELSCENTNTPLPYIDLVNEILEDVVAPPTPVTLNSAIEVDLTPGTIKQTVVDELAENNVAIGVDATVYAPDSRSQWAIRDQQHAYKLFKTGALLHLLPTKQTFLSSAELRANPEYTNKDAYDKLRGEIFPLNVPFDLWHLQARTYLNHLGISQPRLFELFQQKLADNVTLSPTDLQLDCAWLGITETERKIITGALPGKQSWEFWGLTDTGNNIPNPENPADPTENITGTWVNVLSSVNVMLNRSGLAYKELLQLLDMKYVNPTGSIFIFDTADSNAANCDTSKFSIRNLTEDALNRIHRFIRLWRRLGCAMWELDILLPDTNPDPNIIDKQISDGVLQDISMMKRLVDKYGLEWRIIYSLYNEIDNYIYIDRNKDSAPAIQTLYQRLFRNKLVDAVVVFPETPEKISGAIADKVPGILAAFRIKETDLDLILKDLGLTTTDGLDWKVLSRIHRITVLAEALSLNIDGFLRLKRLWAQDPFANPAATHVFIRLVEKVADSEFSVVELDYLLEHQFTPNSGVALDDKAVTTVLQSMREGLQKINDDLHLKTEEALEAYVKSKLGLLPALVKDGDQVKALAIIDGSWEGSVADRDKLIDDYFIDVLDLAVAKTKLAAIPAGLSPVNRQEEVDKRFGYVQPALEKFLLKTQSDVLILQKTAEFLQLDTLTVNELIIKLRLAGATDSLLQTINDLRLIKKLNDGNYQFSLDETNFSEIFKSLRLLHKNALLIGRLKIKSQELAWWLDGSHVADMGWMHPNDFPIDNTTTVPIAQWEHIYDFFRWKSNLPKSEITSFEFLDKVLDTTVSEEENINSLAKLAAWQAIDISDLVGAKAFRWDVKQEFKKPESLIRLADCMRALRRLGINALRAIQWANPEPAFDDAESLKQTVKAKYDLTQWQQIIKPIQDEFREQKRTALVSWLITHPDQAKRQNWFDANGLYSYFLIDVEMSACMLSSRLKQAAASAQLFVQRCLMNLEKDILAKTDLDPKWKQWKWMRYYRVWEANRKVFLYPENWLEPELRDEKSPFFKDLENELMQNDINRDTVEQAYLNYLEKLDKVANLEIRAMTTEIISQDESVLHTFGRSRSSLAPEYYYRKRINGARWTAWEKIELEISANHLVAGIHNRRLYLLWPQFLEKAEQPTTVSTPKADSNTTIAQPNKYWEVRLFWSELKKGKWAPKLLSDTYYKVEQFITGGPYTENITFKIRNRPYIDTRVFYTSSSTSTAPVSFYGYHKIGKQIDLRQESTSEDLVTAVNSIFFNNLIKCNDKKLHFFYNSFEEAGKPHAINPHKDAESILLLNNSLPVSLIAIDSSAQTLSGKGTFFHWDSNRTFFVAYVWEDRVVYSASIRDWITQKTRAFEFFIHYHPFIELFIKELNIFGVKGLLNRNIQVNPASLPGSPAVFNFGDYLPTNKVQKNKRPDGSFSYPIEEVDFSYLGAYSPYNWELFFHVPFFIANKLSTNQRFEEALEWFHYIFDPTNADNTILNPDTPQQKYWITKPFYETTKADYYKQKIENLLLAIAKGDTELREQVKEWRDNPFNPHLIARMRTVAYQKNVLIKYIQMLIAWGDQLFRRDTIETVNEATQLYILAASVLGPRPKSIPKKVANPIKTFYQLEKEGIDDFGNVLKEVENLLPAVSSGTALGDDKPELPRLNVLYFCIPNNEKLLTLWDTVADRLFKIRHCMNIEGVVRQLPLFEPPIDPALLVKATAAGLDIGSVLADLNAPMPLYRFSFMIQRALEICNEVKSLGNAMLSALEKKDVEAFSLLRSNHELVMLDQVRLIKTKQIEEAKAAWDAFIESKKVIEERKTYYEKLVNDGVNEWEILSLSLTGGAIVAEIVATVLNALGSGTSLIPEVNAGASGFGGSPHMTLTLGGKSVTSATSKAADVSKGIASILQIGAGMTATIGNYNRRAEEWDFQKRLAIKELPHIDKQITSAEIRHQIVDQELKNHDKQKENAEKEKEFLSSKFTNQELYDWMINQISTVYFQSYQLAYDIAKRAERCFRYEFGLSESSYIQFGYWDSLKKGLLSGEKLFYDLKRLETAYYEQNRREYELIKHISLTQLDPIALLKLRQNGECIIDIPETVFDMDYPGHYFRRLKMVGISIPCIAGPYTTIACTLTLLSNHLRKDATLSGGKYERDINNEDPRFRDEIAAIQSIATSNAQNDSGMFELNFRDERYLPFEGTGAISTWQIKLNKDFPQFDFSTITDMIIHLNYTAREGGELLKSKAVEEFNKKMNDLALAEDKRGLFRIYDLKREYSDKWYKFLHPANSTDDQALVLDDLANRLPFFTKQFKTKKVKQIEVVAMVKNAGDTFKVELSPLGTTAADLLSLGVDPVYQGLHRAFKNLAGSEVNLDQWTLKVQLDGAGDFKSLPKDAIDELFLIINYTIA